MSSELPPEDPLQPKRDKTKLKLAWGEKPQSVAQPGSQDSGDQAAKRNKLMAPYLTMPLGGGASSIPSLLPWGVVMPQRRELRLPIPVREHPGYNFVGQILGPRGTTQVWSGQVWSGLV